MMKSQMKRFKLNGEKFPMIIFDLDGTLADCEHRRHFVAGHEKRWVDEEEYFGPAHKGQSGYVWFNKDGTVWNGKKDWQAFYEACDKDGPIKPVADIFYTMQDVFHFERIQIWSGRCESIREKTIDWLLKHTYYHEDIVLKMRPIGDSTPDDVLKEKWLDEAIAAGQKIEMVFDDRPKVIRMWRRRGIFVFNCCQHDKEF